MESFWSRNSENSWTFEFFNSSSLICSHSNPRETFEFTNFPFASFTVLNFRVNGDEREEATMTTRKWRREREIKGWNIWKFLIKFHKAENKTFHFSSIIKTQIKEENVKMEIIMNLNRWNWDWRGFYKDEGVHSQLSASHPPQNVFFDSKLANKKFINESSI